MEVKARIRAALPKIARVMDRSSTRLFARGDLTEILGKGRQDWGLSSATISDLVDVMTNESQLREIHLEFPYRPAVRYAWGEVATFELVQSLNSEAYFSHYTAMHLHELTEQIPKTIYFNTEQPNRGGGGILTQIGIDRAFKGKCRITTNVATYQDRKICLINGGNTGRLGVIDMQAPEGVFDIHVTNVERTLIDATVRPIYAGGVFEVVKAFRIAKARVSVNKIVAYLRKLNYTYPYHQSIGCYMQRAGYKSVQLEMLRDFEIEYDFYLDYNMKETEYDAEWRLHVPKGF